MVSAKDPRVRLQHMLDTIDGILDATSSITAESLSNNFLVLRAIERSVQIISEAAKELPTELRAREPDVPWRDIIGMGNLLRHEYYRIRESDMWDILHNHLPRLKDAVQRLLSDSNA